MKVYEMSVNKITIITPKQMLKENTFKCCCGGMAPLYLFV